MVQMVRELQAAEASGGDFAAAAALNAAAAPRGPSPSALLAGGNETANPELAQTCRCTISAQKLGRPPTLDRAVVPKREPTRYLFILGYAFTGTTAFHALLAQGANASALDNADTEAGQKVLQSPRKEGWSKVGSMEAGTAWKQRPDRWSAPDASFNWTELSETYHRYWDLDKPLLVENSPPEMNRADALNRTFSPMGKVRFVVLAHSMCAHDGKVSNACDPSEGNLTTHTHCWSQRAAQAVGIARRFGEDAIVVRYEDLCLQWGATMAALESWEPLLGGSSRLGGSPVLRQRLDQKFVGSHSHGDLSIERYCTEVNRPKWEVGLRLSTPIVPKAEMARLHKDGAAYLGYTSVDACVQ